MNLQYFHSLVEQALDQLPDEFHQKLENVAVTVQIWPDQDQLRSVGMRSSSGMLLGLYQGVPRTKQSNVFHPAKITLFAGPLIRTSTSLDQLQQNIQRVLKHEVGHHFGMSDHHLHSKGY
jgi:predicted Zn-dependent protease with MMP-like domain